MAYTAPLFYISVVGIINLLLFILSLIVQGVAFVHCLTQRSDGFTAIGTLPKGAWVAILAVCFVLTLVFKKPIGIIGLISIAAAAIYLLDVRPGLRDLSDGKGSW